MKNLNLLTLFFQTLSICFLIILNTSTISSQKDCVPVEDFTNGGFEDVSGCTTAGVACYAGAFGMSCVAGWGAAHGSPDACWQALNDPAGPYEGEYMAAMGSNGVPLPGECGNEAIFKDVDLDIDKTYKLGFHHRTGTYATALAKVNVYVYLTSGFTNVSGIELDPCDEINLPEGSSLIFSENNLLSTEWLSVEKTFSPVEGMNQLLFFVVPAEQYNGTTYWLVDGVSLEECDPCQASFEVCQGRDCTVHLINTSTPSTDNDCGDCENPTGIVSSTWSIGEYHNGPPPYVSIGEGSQSYNMSFMPTSADNDGYQICLQIEDCSGCISRHCEVFQFRLCKEGNTSESRDNNKPISKTEYLLYPNPASQQIQLEIEADQTFDGALKIYDLRGKLVKQIDNIKSGYSSINVESIPTGVYLFNVVNQGKIDYSQKIMIE